jgi:hypothetical protein
VGWLGERQYLPVLLRVTIVGLWRLGSLLDFYDREYARDVILLLCFSQYEGVRAWMSCDERVDEALCDLVVQLATDDPSVLQRQGYHSHESGHGVRQVQ